MEAEQLLAANRRRVAPTLMEGSLRPNCSLAASGSAMSLSFPKWGACPPHLPLDFGQRCGDESSQYLAREGALAASDREVESSAVPPREAARLEAA